MKYHQNLSGVFLELHCVWVLDPPQAIIQPRNCSLVLQKKAVFKICLFLKNLTEGCFPRYFYYEEAYVLLGGVAKMLVNTFRVFVFVIYVP